MSRKRPRSDSAARWEPLGSGNHYLEVQLVAQVYDADTAAAFDLREGEIVIKGEFV